MENNRANAIRSETIKRIITGSVLAVSFLAIFIYAPAWVFSLILVAILGIIITIEWPCLFDIHGWPFWVIMPFYPIAPFVFLILLNQNPTYRPLLFMLIVMVASSDTGAYIIGKLFGKHALASRISPGKTIEGFFGGYWAATISLFVLLSQKPLPFSYALSIAIATLGFLVNGIAAAGDLFESWLKRRAGIKDSGTLLPGQGGFLDRFDGILFAAYFFYLFKYQLTALFDLKDIL